jgi:hypothetical protein
MVLAANDALPAFRMGVVPDGLVAAACITVAPLSRPETAAATIAVFIECFMCHSSRDFARSRPGAQILGIEAPGG